MILYKYIDRKSLTCFFHQGYLSIKFTPFNEFNDPFESYGVSIEQGEDKNSLVYITARDELRKKAACLCLSKNPLNVLMWSHYAEHHRGFVIAIDTEKAGFEDESSCIVTASKGKMDYLEIRNEHKIKVKLEDIHNPETISKMLLNKSIDWKYEEEYRVIKNFDSLEQVKTNDDSLWVDHIINLESVIAIFKGMKNDNLDSIIDNNSVLKNLVINKKIELYKCDFKSKEWGLQVRDYSYYMPPEKYGITPRRTRSDSHEFLMRVIKEIDRNNT